MVDIHHFGMQLSKFVTPETGLGHDIYAGSVNASHRGIGY